MVQNQILTEHYLLLETVSIKNVGLYSGLEQNYPLCLVPFFKRRVKISFLV
jgi:hypothetical protein